MAHCQFTKVHQRVHLRAAIDRFLHSLPLNKPSYAGVLEPIGNGKILIFSMNRRRDCSTAMTSEGQRAKLPHNCRGRPSFNSVSLLADKVERINAN